MCMCVCVCVTYEDTTFYNDMVMTYYKEKVILSGHLGGVGLGEVLV